MYNKHCLRYSKICRLCMNETQLSNMFLSPGNVKLSQKIVFCNLALVNEEDEFPKFICKECENKLCDFYEFKLKCDSIELKLKELIKKEQLEPNTFHDYDIDKNIHCTLEDEDSNNSLTIDQLSDNVVSNEIVESKNLLLAEINRDKESDIVNTETTRNTSKHQCDKCGKTFQTKGVLTKHFASHENKKEFVCGLCHKRYARKDYLTSHMKKHKGIQKFICEVCSMKFYNKHDLLRHVRVHSDERLYSCQRCDKKFKRSFDITSHMRVHTGHRPFVCKECPKSYKSHSGLKKHYKNHKEIKSIIDFCRDVL